MRLVAKTCALVAAFVLWFGSAAEVEAQQKHFVTIGTTNSASSVYAYYAALAKVAAERGSPMQITVAETGGTEENLSRMGSGQFDAGLAVQRSIVEAYEGKGKVWEGKPQKQLRLLNLFYVAPQAFVVRQDSGVTSMEELNGKPWSPGHRGSGSENATLAILEALGIEPDLYRGALTDIVRATQDGEIIGFSKGLPGFRLDATMLDIQANHPIRMIGFNEQEQQILREKMPELPLLELPAGLAQTEEPIMSWAFLGATVVNADLPDEAVYELAKLAAEETAALGQAFKPVAETDLVALTRERAAIPLHPGAIRYYQEKGHEIPERLVP